MSLFLIIGCGNGHIPLRGNVTFSDDSSPVTKGTVLFVQGEFQASGDIQPDGSYVVGSYTSKDGLPLGMYEVSVIGVTDTLPGETLHSIIDPKYETVSTSGLTINVDSSTKNYDLKLDRNPKK
ncbi:MAG: hypothetical protein LBG58_11480 [Planctomycetaceae bacterium]|nr:hypothetical protein [Planctomycetaceae bacterium]